MSGDGERDDGRWPWMPTPSPCLALAGAARNPQAPVSSRAENGKSRHEEEAVAEAYSQANSRRLQRAPAVARSTAAGNAGPLPGHEAGPGQGEGRAGARAAPSREMAEGEIPVANNPMKFLVVELDIDANTTDLGLIRRVNMAISRALQDSEPARSFLTTAWEFLPRVQALGMSI